MTVGDMVIRAYTWKDWVPGIIVGEDYCVVSLDNDSGNSEKPWSYEQVTFEIHWSDGSISKETSEELEYLVHAYRKHFPKGDIEE